MKILFSAFVSFMLCMVIVSCSVFGNEKLPGLDVPLSQMNRDLQVVAPKGWNTFKTTDPIALEIRVLGDHTVVFQPDFDAQVFIFGDGKWSKIDYVTDNPGEFPDDLSYWRDDTANSPDRNPNDLMYLSASSSSVGFMILLPLLQDTTQKAEIRIVIVGYTFQNGIVTNESVMAYTDVLLNP